MTFKFDKAKIVAVATATGKNSEDTLNKCLTFTDEQKAKKIIKSLGFKHLKYTDKTNTTADLCIACAQKIFDNNIIKKEEIDALIFVTQTPDSLVPATSFYMQDKLGLSHQTLLFDLTQGCSGFVYGLLFAHQLIESNSVKNVLLCCGDTSWATKNVYGQEANTILFGDGGCCTLVQTTKDRKSYFSCDNSGELRDIINNNYFSFKRFRADHGTVELDDIFSCKINGLELANYTMDVAKNNILETLKEANLTLNDISYCITHQANKNLLKSLAMTLGVSSNTLPFLAENTGNTSSASIPLAICENKEKLTDLTKKPVLLSGFGVGMSVASCIVDLEGCAFLDTIYM